MSHQTLPSTVFEGEAPESDEDDDIQEENLGLLVSGEAPESDTEQSTDGSSPSLPPLQVDPAAEGDHLEEEEEINQKVEVDVDIQPKKLKYETLLHKKLRERNASLYKNFNEYMSQKYVSAINDVREITKSLTKSQVAIQDVSHNLRLLTNDLFHLEDRIDIIASCAILPTIVLNAAS